MELGPDENMYYCFFVRKTIQIQSAQRTDAFNFLTIEQKQEQDVINNYGNIWFSYVLAVISEVDYKHF